jgi:hypothetical protein
MKTVGRTPWSARVPLDPFLTGESYLTRLGGKPASTVTAWFGAFAEDHSLTVVALIGAARVGKRSLGSTEYRGRRTSGPGGKPARGPAADRGVRPT